MVEGGYGQGFESATVDNWRARRDSNPEPPRFEAWCSIQLSYGRVARIVLAIRVESQVPSLAAPADQPLAGITVLDLGQIYNGPYCG